MCFRPDTECYIHLLGARDFDSQSMKTSQWDFECLSTRYAKHLLKNTILKRGISDVRNNTGLGSI